MHLETFLIIKESRVFFFVVFRLNVTSHQSFGGRACIKLID